MSIKRTGDALQVLLQHEKEAREFGFDWENEAMILNQVIDECREISESIVKNESKERIQEEIGDLMHAAISLCLFAGFDVEETLAKINLKFDKRMQVLKKMTHEMGLGDLKNQTTEFMMALWEQAKRENE